MDKMEDAMKQVITLKMLMAKMNIIDKDGNKVSVDKCHIDTNGIKNLSNVIDNEEMDKINTEKLSNHFVVPIYTPDGTKIDVEVNNQEIGIQAEMELIEGQEEAIFLLQDEVNQMIPAGLENSVNIEEYMRTFSPKNFNELAQDLIKNGKIIPESKNEAIQMVTKEGLEKSANKDNNIENTNNLKDNEKNIDNSDIDEVPEEVRDEVKKICEENGLKISSLKQVLIVPATTVIENGTNTGIRANGGNVTMLRFKDASMVDKVVTFQDGRVLTNVGNDERYSQLMQRTYGRKVKDLKDDESKIVYNDLDGHTIVDDLVKSPNDLTVNEKEEFNKKWDKLQKETMQLLNSDIPEKEKKEEFERLNNEKILCSKKYGIKLNIIESEIKADIDISQESKNDESEQLKEETKIQEDDDNDEYDHFPTRGERNGPFDTNRWTY